MMWTGKPTRRRGAHARNAVFYGDKAIDRSPCGTGTSARMAQLAAKGKLKVGDDFVHESIIGSLFNGRVESDGQGRQPRGDHPSIAGWARQTGINTIFIDDRDPFAPRFPGRLGGPPWPIVTLQRDGAVIALPTNTALARNTVIYLRRFAHELVAGSTGTAAALRRKMRHAQKLRWLFHILLCRCAY